MTPKEINVKEINHLLDTFSEQFNQACEHPDVIPLIEMDLMKQTLRNLYTQLDQLGKMKEIALSQNISNPITEEKNSLSNSALLENKNTAIIQEMIIEKIEIISTPQFVAIDHHHTEKEAEKVIPVLENNAVLENILVNELSLSTETAHPTPVAETTKISKPELKKGMMGGLFDETPSVASKFNSAETIYDKITKSQHDTSLADKLTMTPVEDLKKSIGINARFAFINELFSGDQYLFHESIDRINKSAAFEDARKVLYEELADKMNWNTSTKPFSDLEELVKRRFGV